MTLRLQIFTTQKNVMVYPCNGIVYNQCVQYTIQNEIINVTKFVFKIHLFVSNM
jgi:hypothetical protein